METYHVKRIDSITARNPAGFPVYELLQIGPIFAIRENHPVFDSSVTYYDEEKAQDIWSKMLESRAKAEEKRAQKVT